MPVWQMTFQDVADVLYIKSRPCASLQSHSIAQDDWQRSPFSAIFHRIAAKLLATKYSFRNQSPKRKSLGAETDLFGKAGGRGASDGLAGDIASEYRVDRVEEAGFSSSNWSNEQNTNVSHRAVDGFVELNILHQLLPLPVETREK